MAFPDASRVALLVVLVVRVDLREVFERLDFPDVTEFVSSSRKLVADPPLQMGHIPVTWSCVSIQNDQSVIEESMNVV